MAFLSSFRLNAMRSSICICLTLAVRGLKIAFGISHMMMKKTAIMPAMTLEIFLSSKECLGVAAMVCCVGSAPTTDLQWSLVLRWSRIVFFLNREQRIERVLIHRHLIKSPSGIIGNQPAKQI